MSGYVLPPPPQASVAVEGSADRFPVRRIFCVGRNYAEHVREMGYKPEESPPFFFSKPADAVVDSGASIAYPPMTADLHHEAELVLALGQGGANLAPEDCLALIWGLAAGNDLTRRDLQAEAKQLRRPWDMSKGFDASAVVGPIRRFDGSLPQGRIRCTVDGRITQDAQLSEMIWNVPALLSYLSRFVTLRPGDLVFTGTPAGVGPIVSGQTCTVEIDGLLPATVTLT